MKLSPEQLTELVETSRLFIVHKYANLYKVKNFRSYRLERIEELRNKVLELHEQDFDPVKPQPSEKIMKAREYALQKYRKESGKNTILRYEKKINDALAEGNSAEVERLTKILDFKKKVIEKNETF